MQYRVWGRMTPLGTYIRMNTEIHGWNGKWGAGGRDWKDRQGSGVEGRKERREGGREEGREKGRGEGRWEGGKREREGGREEGRTDCGSAPADPQGKREKGEGASEAEPSGWRLSWSCCHRAHLLPWP